MMTSLRATIKGGRLELDVPRNWPDGTEVEIHPIERGPAGGTAAMSPEEIARTLSAMQQIEGFDMADRRARKERDRAQFAEHAEKLRQQCERRDFCWISDGQSELLA
jgi:hypothetical protein